MSLRDRWHRRTHVHRRARQGPVDVLLCSPRYRRRTTVDVLVRVRPADWTGATLAQLEGLLRRTPGGWEELP